MSFFTFISYTSLIVSLIIGGVVGYLSGIFIKERSLGLLGNIIVGMTGGVLGIIIFGFIGVPDPYFVGTAGVSIVSAAALWQVVSFFNKRV